jgi:hypothetical protein
MKDNLKITEFVDYIQSNVIDKIRLNGDLISVTFNSTTLILTLTIDSVIGIVHGDNIQITGVSTAIDGIYKVDTIDLAHNRLTASQKFVPGVGWQTLTSTLTIPSFTNVIWNVITPGFIRGNFSQLNRYIDENYQHLNKFPVIFMSNYWIGSLIMNKNNNSVGQKFDNLIFGFFENTDEINTSDQPDEIEKIWDRTDAMAYQFLEYLQQANRANSGMRNIIDSANVRRDNFYIYDDRSVEFDLKATGTVLEFPLIIENTKVICY